MKKSLFYAVTVIALLSSCGNGAKLDEAQRELADQKALNDATREELQSAVAERDELLDIINGISANVEDIKNIEKIITVNGGIEGGNKAQINNSINAIKATLAERRQKLDNLEAKLKDSKLTNTKLLETIESLKKQIAMQEDQIFELTSNLDAAHKRINQLGSAVDSLSTTVKTVTNQRDEAQSQAQQQADLANECFYAIGSSKELKEHDILHSGFLRKTKIMQGDFDKTYFTKADKRTLTSIPLHSKKAKVITKSQPDGSYEIVDVNGQKVLNITNPAEFWRTSNYVVIQID